MKNKDNFTQTEYNPFDGPVAGQSLTDEPGNYPWEHAPQYTDPEEAMSFLHEKVSEPEIVEQVIGMLDSGVPVEAIVRVMTFSGFMNGKFTPDLAFTLVQPLMNMVSAIGIRAGIEKMALSLEDLSNKKFISGIVELKAAREKIEQTSKEIAEDIPKETAPKGLLSKPEPTEEI